jgi:predicted kinase
MRTAHVVLVVVGGLPGSGKTTVAAAHVRASGAAFLRIDTIEQTIVDRTTLEQPLGPVGYEVGYALAGEQLRLGVDVVAECVNPLAVTRDAWRRTADDAGAGLVDVEVVCSDPAEHRRRVETRTSDVPGLVLPTWRQVTGREYEPWDRERLVVDTAHVGPDGAAARISEAVRRAR